MTGLRTSTWQTCGRRPAIEWRRRESFKRMRLKKFERSIANTLEEILYFAIAAGDFKMQARRPELKWVAGPGRATPGSLITMAFRTCTSLTAWSLALRAH